MTRRRNNDPRWITVRYACECAVSTCKKLIARGDSAFYYPATRRMLCHSCGDDASREFNAHAFDEANNACL